MTGRLVPECDAESPSVYLHEFPQGGVPVYRCRCIVCARCGHHTGNATQGHYWGYCKKRQGLQQHHFCCPDDCELDASIGERPVVPPVHPDMADLAPAHLPRVGRPVLWDDKGRDSSS